MAEAKKLIGYKQIAIAWFITQYLVDKEEEDANFHFGGFGGMAKAGAYEDLEIRESHDVGTFNFKFRQLAAGSKTLISKLPTRKVGTQTVFDLEIGKPTNAITLPTETSFWSTPADDGAGLVPGFSLDQNAGTGLRNIRVRLQQLFGGGARLTIDSRQGGGTIVDITMPADAEGKRARASA